MSKHKEIISSWVNKRNNDNFSPLHYASFNGNLEVCQMLIEAGADTQVMNKFGLTALHTAAQGDQPQTLYFFHKIHKMNIN